MQSVEAEGGSIDDAIERALSLLGVERSKVQIDILENAERGVLGIGGRPAKVRATIRDAAPDVSRETVSGLASQVLREIVAHLVDDPRVDVSADDGATIALSVVSIDGGSIIGRRGQTLDALDHLVNRIVFRDDKAAPGRINVDVEGYRERREESLRDLARRLAEKVQEKRQVITVNPLSPRDRRIVHLELEKNPDVSTRSEGEGLLRRLLIVPANGSPRR